MAPWKRFSFLLFCLACPLLVWSQTGLTSLRSYDRRFLGSPTGRRRGQPWESIEWLTVERVQQFSLRFGFQVAEWRGAQNVGGVFTQRTAACLLVGLNQRWPRLLSNQKLSPCSSR